MTGILKLLAFRAIFDQEIVFGEEGNNKLVTPSEQRAMTSNNQNSIKFYFKLQSSPSKNQSKPVKSREEQREGNSIQLSLNTIFEELKQKESSKNNFESKEKTKKRSSNEISLSDSYSNEVPAKKRKQSNTSFERNATSVTEIHQTHFIYPGSTSHNDSNKLHSDSSFVSGTLISSSFSNSSHLDKETFRDKENHYRIVHTIFRDIELGVLPPKAFFSFRFNNLSTTNSKIFISCY